jgi:hypothetical protein
MRNLLRYLTTLAAGLLAVPASAITPTPPPPFVANQFNPADVITVDGIFTSPSEWAGVIPLAFQSGSPPVPVGLGSGDTLVYAVLGPGAAAAKAELYLMYDYLSRTNTTYSAGDLIGQIDFPITIGNAKHDLSVLIKAASNAPLPPGSVPDTFFDVFFQVDLNGINCGLTPSHPVCAIEAGVGFAPSKPGSGSSSPHLLIELEVPLLTANGFFTNPLLQHNGYDGVYSPDPAFWNAAATKDVGDPPIASALFQILPNGSTVACPVPLSALCPVAAPSAVPLPSSLLLMLIGGLALVSTGYRSLRTAHA